jgi:hypothetical protein
LANFVAPGIQQHSRQTTTRPECVSERDIGQVVR